VVKQGTHEMTFRLAANTQVTEGKKTLPASDLEKAVGHQVKVRYTVSAGSKVADRLELSAAMPTHTPAPPAKSPTPGPKQ